VCASYDNDQRPIRQRLDNLDSATLKLFDSVDAAYPAMHEPLDYEWGVLRERTTVQWLNYKELDVSSDRRGPCGLAVTFIGNFYFVLFSFLALILFFSICVCLFGVESIVQQ
jgi:hypothetical protein